MNELNKDDLTSVSGGQYRMDVPYLETLVIRDGDLLNVRNIRQIVGHITAGQTVWLNSDYKYYAPGEYVGSCVVRIDGPEGADYVTDRMNLEM